MYDNSGPKDVLIIKNRVVIEYCGTLHASHHITVHATSFSHGKCIGHKPKRSGGQAKSPGVRPQYGQTSSFVLTPFSGQMALETTSIPKSGINSMDNMIELSIIQTHTVIIK